MTQPPVNGVFRAVWLIIDPDRRRADLIAEAEALLPDLAESAGVVLTGPTSWDTTRHGYDLPGWERWLGYVLVAETPANRVLPDPAVVAADAVADVDWTAVEIALSGERPVNLSPDEKRAAVQLGEKQGMTRTALARRLRLSGTTVNEYAEADLAVDWAVAA
jgi:hypothetical protein